MKTDLPRSFALQIDRKVVDGGEKRGYTGHKLPAPQQPQSPAPQPAPTPSSPQTEKK